MNIRTIFSAIALSVIAISSTVSAQRYSLGYDQVRYDATLGESVELLLILTEEFSDGEASRLAAGGNNGLFSFSADTDYTLFNGSSRGISFDSFVLNDLFTTGFAGSGEDITTGPSNVSFEGVEDFAGNDTDGEGGVGGTMISANTFAIELGTLTFNAAVDDTATLIELGPHTAANANPFLFADGFEAVVTYTNSEIIVGDGIPFSIPEPSSLAFLALLAGTGFLKRRRI